MDYWALVNKGKGPTKGTKHSCDLRFLSCAFYLVSFAFFFRSLEFFFARCLSCALLRVAAVHEGSVESSEVGEDARHDGRKSRVIGDLVDSVRQLALQLVEGVLRRPPNGAVRWARLHAMPCLLNQVGHARVEVRGEVVMHKVALLAACYGRRECRDNRGHVGLVDLYRSACHLGQAPPLRPTRRNSQNERPLFPVPVHAGCADAHRRNALAVGAVFLSIHSPASSLSSMCCRGVPSTPTGYGCDHHKRARIKFCGVNAWFAVVDPTLRVSPISCSRVEMAWREYKTGLLECCAMNTLTSSA